MLAILNSLNELSAMLEEGHSSLLEQANVIKLKQDSTQKNITDIGARLAALETKSRLPRWSKQYSETASITCEIYHVETF